MELIGDIERFVAQNLYPLRVPIAILIVVVVGALGWLAYRRRWDRAARAHPRGSAVTLVVLLVVGLPLAWYLGSPLFITTHLQETPPPVAAGPTASGPSGTGGGSATPEATVSPPPERSGTFMGADDFHFGRGTARLIATGQDAWTLRFEDFSVRNGPDLYVFLSPDADGYADGALELGTLKATDGAFNYALPAGTDPATYRSVVVWCKQFAVQFAHASLAP